MHAIDQLNQAYQRKRHENNKKLLAQVSSQMMRIDPNNILDGASALVTDLEMSTYVAQRREEALASAYFAANETIQTELTRVLRLAGVDPETYALPSEVLDELFDDL